METENSEMNCMTVIVGKAITHNRRVLIGHNEDDGGLVAVRRTYVPPRDWPAGSTLPAEAGLAAVPQVPHTFGYYWIEYKKDAGGLTTADAFANENGVVITSNSMGKTKEDTEDATIVRDGGIGFNLRRILAERSQSARDGARILMEMIETWGYAYPGRAYTIADAEEAFMFQLVRGRHYVGARVPDDAAAVMPNHYNFHTLHDCPEMFYSEDIVSYAVQKGWYKPAKPGDYSDFDFAAAYENNGEWKEAGNLYRQKHGQRLLLERDWDVEREGTPFVIYPKRTIDVAALARLFSTHYEGTPDDCERFGPGRSPHDTANVRRICAGITLECDIYEFGIQPALLTVFTCLGRPCELPFLPLHPLLGLPDSLCERLQLEEMMATHLLPEADACSHASSVRQRYRDFESRLELCYSDEIAEVTPMLAAMRREAEAASGALLADVQALIMASRAGEARRLAAARDDAFILEKLAQLESYAQTHTSPLTIDAPAPICLSNPPAYIELAFNSAYALNEDGMIFGCEHTDTRQNFAAAEAGSLAACAPGSFRVRFPSAAILKELEPGRHLFWLGATNARGWAVAASVLVEVQP